MISKMQLISVAFVDFNSCAYSAGIEDCKIVCVYIYVCFAEVNGIVLTNQIPIRKSVTR